ncbi:glutamate--tRNA ligase [Dictyobacter arantiisoli]|uniref:Glutamate--tRNA ligase n=1 Tax=Dictyobacter arantiisoli TaxID=2014874 RepID=A0A5A5T9M6_9CHLR|nr:glutamate--tRNA ligase [Dictyobacter arantiisoli]GCF07856.1 glutamate--tRNA ligase [Dictyobacter arantiisoli]
MTQIDNHAEGSDATNAPRLRFAPSPTGFLHIGAFRTALFSWLYARHSGGKFILRIEDTDLARTVEGAVEDFTDGLRWLGMDVDEGPDIGGPYGPYYQVQRKALYQQYANQLLESGHAYRCYCTPERLDAMRKEQIANKLPPRYDRHCRYLSPEERATIEASGATWVVRFAMPLEGETVVHDELHGDMVFKNSDIDDTVIMKTNGLAPYHLAHLVDDHLMKITHVLRGEEWISSAPRHVQIYQALGWPVPLFYHVPNVLGKDKKKLSKRRNAPSWSDYKKQGYLPEAVFNFLALLGWAYDDKTEIFTQDELIKAFTLKKIGISSGIYDPDKLLWMNGLYIRNLPLAELVERTIPYMELAEDEGGLPASIVRPLDRAYTTRVLALEHERLKTLGEAAHVVSFFYEKEIDYSLDILIQKKMDAASTREALLQTRTLLNSLSTWEHSILEAQLRELVTKLGLKNGQVFGTIRTAVSGRTATPPLFEMMEVLGRDVCMQRIDQAIARLG